MRRVRATGALLAGETRSPRATRGSEEEFPVASLASCFDEGSAQGEDVLILAAQNGDNEAFSELMSRAWDVCLHVAISRLGNRDDAMDEVQDAFCKAYTHIREFRGKSKFSTWVVRIVINSCLMRLRRKTRQRTMPFEGINAHGEEYVAYEPVDRQTPEDMLGGVELQAAVRLELSRIPTSLRTPLELTYIRSLTLEEVARSLNISVAATKSRLHRGQLYLKDRMLRHCGVRGSGTLTRAS